MRATHAPASLVIRPTKRINLQMAYLAGEEEEV